MSTGFNSKVSQQTQSIEKPWSEKTGDEKWNDVTTHRAWRHTIGRISSAIRIPIYAIGVACQGVKTVIKAIVSPLVSFGRWATGSKKLESWSFTGVARDAIMFGSLIDKTLNSALCVICAPPKQYHSLWGALKATGNIVVLGKQHRLTVSELFFKQVTLRAQFHKQIVQCDCIYSSKLGSVGHMEKVGGFSIPTRDLAKKIKAG